MKKLINIKLSPLERKTFSLHMFYSALEGIILGVLAMNEFIFITSLKGTDYMVAFLFLFSMAVHLLLVFFNEFLKRTVNKKKMLRIVAIVTRLPLIALMFFPTEGNAYLENPVYHYLFLGIFLIYFLGNPVIVPTVNLFLKNIYSHDNFGKLYSYASSVNRIITLISTFLCGLILDYNNYAFIYIYPFMAIAGLSSVFILSKIKYIEKQTKQIKRTVMQSVKESVKSMYSILRFDKPYFYFELSFMFYGFAFMITYAVVNIFFGEDGLDLNYSSVAFYKNSYNILAIFLLPLFGKLLGNIDPRKFGIITFSSLMLYLVFLALTEYFPVYTEFMGLKFYTFMVIAFLFYGIFASTMNLLWWIGSAYFCKNEDAGIYQSVHLSLTGLRSVIAPLFGIYIYELFGFSITFLIGAFSLFIGVILLYWSFIKHKISVK